MKKSEFGLVGLATLFALPFLAATPLRALLGLTAALFPQAPPLGLVFALDLPFFSITRLLSDVTRYLVISLAALLLTLIALAWLVVRERGQIWRHKRFYWLTVALVAVLAFPLLIRYQPAFKAVPGVEMRVVDKPGLLAGAVKSCQAAAEVRECQYEPLGWADAQTLVYRQWCGGYYDMSDWRPGDPQPLRAYHLGTDTISPFDGDPDALSRETCRPSQCVSPALGEKQLFPLSYLPGQYKDALVSPDGCWVTFTAEHVYGPEDLLVISNE
jgi:hypothetical protein